VPAIKIGFVKNYTLEYKLRIVEASKNSVSQRAFAASQNLDEKTLLQWRNNEHHHFENNELFLIDE